MQLFSLDPQFVDEVLLANEVEVAVMVSIGLQQKQTFETEDPIRISFL